MKRLLVLLVVVVVVGVCLGWFHFSSSKDANTPDFTVAVDKDKIKADKNKAVNELKTLEHKATDKIEATSQPGQN